MNTAVATQQDWLGLSGRVCVVTGAGSGIGAAIAEGLVEVGAHVALLDRDSAAADKIALRLTERACAASSGPAQR